jgi:hypothetical protein
LAINGGGKIDTGYTHLRCGLCEGCFEKNQSSNCDNFG